MHTTSKFNLPLLHQNQSMKEIIINESLSKIDSFIASSIIAETESLPDNAENGNLYLFRPPKTSDLFKYYDHLAHFNNHKWEFITPKDGMLFFLRNHNKFLLFDKVAWGFISL